MKGELSIKLVIENGDIVDVVPLNGEKKEVLTGEIKLKANAKGHAIMVEQYNPTCVTYYTPAGPIRICR